MLSFPPQLLFALKERVPSAPRLAGILAYINREMYQEILNIWLCIPANLVEIDDLPPWLRVASRNVACLAGVLDSVAPVVLMLDGTLPQVGPGATASAL